jgi:hypothetical protein
MIPWDNDVLSMGCTLCFFPGKQYVTSGLRGNLCLWKSGRFTECLGRRIYFVLHVSIRRPNAPGNLRESYLDRLDVDSK